MAAEVQGKVQVTGNFRYSAPRREGAYNGRQREEDGDKVQCWNFRTIYGGIGTE